MKVYFEFENILCSFHNDSGLIIPGIISTNFVKNSASYKVCLALNSFYHLFLNKLSLSQFELEIKTKIWMAPL